MNSKLKIYIGVLLVVNILFFGFQYYLNHKYINKLQMLNNFYASIQQKEILLFQLNENVSELENQLFANGIFSINNTLLKCRDKKIKKIISKINNILNILEKGGEVKEEVYANLVKYKKVSKNIYIEKEKDKFYIEDIKATLSLLSKFITKIDKLIINRNKNFSNENIYKLKYYLKLIPSIIERTKENINNYLFVTEKRLRAIEKEKKEVLKEFFEVHLWLFLMVIIINFGVFYFVLIDVQKINEELKRRLYYDKLTGLKNRLKLVEEVKEGVLFILDIDNFGTYNELYGNKIGDEILKKVVEILSKKIKKDYLYRIGSDEFAILFEKNINIIEKIEFLEKIFKENVIRIESLKIENLKFKIGISNIPNLLDNAFIALKIAKEKNKKYHIFSLEDIQKEQEKNKKVIFWTQKIQYAIDNDLIVPVFQPIVDKNERIFKYEMLLRIKDKEKLIPPIFLDIAIKNNQYIDISKIMFSKAIEYINKKIPISFNINYLDMEELYEFYKKKLFNECYYPHLLTFEILESSAIKNYEELNEKIKRFREIGVKLAIDDFGSGYSNYRHILEIKPDFLKIDGSLIKDILMDNNSFYIVESIQRLAKKTGIVTIAEFVENKEIFEKLKSIGINYFQGYYFSKPIEL